MAQILPFRALRYSRHRVPAEQVVTQPYDKISPEMQRRYLERHPNNIVRIIRPESNPPADPNQSPYDHAGQTLASWRREGILEQDAEPALFAYFQRFRLPDAGEWRTRKGLICLTRLEDYDAGVVFPHERTLSGPKKDRLELLESTRTHFGQVFLLYSDPEHVVDGILDSHASGPPELSLSDEYGAEHLLWRIADAGAIGAVRMNLADKPLVIADGHHRYETGLSFRDRRRGETETGPADWIMTTLVNSQSPGMVILPTHRLVCDLDGFDCEAFLSATEAFFDIESVDSRSELEASIRKGAAGGCTIGFVPASSGRAFVLRLRQGSQSERVLAGLSPEEASLDVVVLHRLVLGECLGITEEQVRDQRRLRYVRGVDATLESLAAPEANAAFLLNPTRLEQVWKMALNGQVLPQKSTDFFPKLLTGLTMYCL